VCSVGGAGGSCYTPSRPRPDVRVPCGGLGACPIDGVNRNGWMAVDVSGGGGGYVPAGG
jgi:hypothetical protein